MDDLYKLLHELIEQVKKTDLDNRIGKLEMRTDEVRELARHVNQKVDITTQDVADLKLKLTEINELLEKVKDNQELLLQRLSGLEKNVSDTEKKYEELSKHIYTNLDGHNVSQLASRVSSLEKLMYRVFLPISVTITGGMAVFLLTHP